jgi:hypothetical protein
MILSKLEAANIMQISKINSSVKDHSAGKENDTITLHFSSNPLPNAEHKISIHETAKTMRQMILGLTLISPIAKVEHWKHLNFIILWKNANIII